MKALKTNDKLFLVPLLRKGMPASTQSVDCSGDYIVNVHDFQNAQLLFLHIVI